MLIRLQHLRTRKWLHSHLHASPISANMEVSKHLCSQHSSFPLHKIFTCKLWSYSFFYWLTEFMKWWSYYVIFGYIPRNNSSRTDTFPLIEATHTAHGIYFIISLGDYSHHVFPLFHLKKPRTILTINKRVCEWVLNVVISCVLLYFIVCYEAFFKYFFFSTVLLNCVQRHKFGFRKSF